MARGVRKLAANLAYARRTAESLGLGEVASSISRIPQTVAEHEAKVAATAAHVATQADSGVAVLRPGACVATQTEIALARLSFMDEMACDSAGGDVDTAVHPTSPEPGLSTKGPAGPTGGEIEAERYEEGASSGMVAFSNRWLQYYLGVLETDSARFAPHHLGRPHRRFATQSVQSALKLNGPSTINEEKNCVILMRALLKSPQECFPGRQASNEFLRQLFV